MSTHMNNWLKVGFPAVLLFLAASCGEKKEAPAGKGGPGKGGPVLIDGYVLSPVTLSNSLSIPGTLEGSERVDLRPEIQGKVISVHFKEGSNVSKGQLLIKLYDADMQAELKGLKIQHELAVKNEKRLKELLSVNGISQQEYDVVATRVAELDASMELVEARISRTEIRAPFSGKIGLRNISPGAMIGPTDIVATLVQTSPLKLDFTLQERYVYALNGKEKVSFQVQGVDGSFNGSIQALESSIDMNTRSLKVRALCENPKGKLMPGAFASVSIAFDEIPDALLVPNQAIIPEVKGKKVIVSRGGKAEFVQVTTGQRDAEKVQILSGLNAGDTIAITGLLSVRPGTELKFKNLQSAQK